ncbi:MAG: phosphodiester glycosidase family protein [Verrucomicrobiota bacterium JB023]|nr:phosphodiester glycosidase family protein [Verrucomicrobiota bacterium JB023]
MKKAPLSLVVSLFVLSCAREAPEAPKRPATPTVQVDPYPGNTSPPPTVENPVPTPSHVHPLKMRQGRAAGVELTLVTFDTRKHTLEVWDQEQGPGSQAETAVSAARGALAAINGGFFTPEGTPLGLVYESGKKFGFLNRSSLGSGVLYVDRKLARPVIARRERFEQWLQDDHFEPYQVLQSGPFLVDEGKAVEGLKNDEARVRSFLLWDGDYHFALAQSEPITLRNLARALAAQPIDGFKIFTALNLDGGRSAELYISEKIEGGPRHLRRWWNKSVRNYVLLKPQ